MSELSDLVVGVLSARGMPVDIDGTMIRTVVRTDEIAFPCAVVVVEELGQLVVYSVHPELVGDEHRGAVGELINRLNSVLTVGNLEIDLDEGQVRFRTGLAVGSASATTEMVERVLLDNVASALAYFPAVDVVVAGGEPQEVVGELRD